MKAGGRLRVTRTGTRQLARLEGAGGAIGSDDALCSDAQSRSARSRRALAMTLTDDSAMAAAATIGDSNRPKAG